MLWLGLLGESLGGCAGPQQAHAPGVVLTAPLAPPAPPVAPRLSITTPLLGETASIASDEEADRARSELDLLTTGSAAHAAIWRGLVKYHVETADQALARDKTERAFEHFRLALSAFPLQEMQSTSAQPQAPDLLRLAQRLDAMYSRRGAHPQVVCAMMVELTLHNPQSDGVRARYQQLVDWLKGQSDGMQNVMRGRGASLQDLLNTPPDTLDSDLEQVYRVWPAKVVRDELTSRYRQEAALLGGGGKRNPKDFLQSLSASMRRKGLTNSPVFKVARVFLRASRAEEAIPVIEQLGRLSGEEAQLLDVLKNTLGQPARAADTAETYEPAILLAKQLAQNPEDAEVSLQICQDLVQRLPTMTKAHLCVGEVALSLDRKTLALRALEQAKTQLPGERPLWEVIGRLYTARLGELVAADRTNELEGELRKIEQFYADLQRQFPNQPENTGLALALAEVGRGYYNAGHLAQASKYLNQSLGLLRHRLALEQLGIMKLRLGQGAEAASHFAEARELTRAQQTEDTQGQRLFEVRMDRLAAEALELSRQGEAAKRKTQASDAAMLRSRALDTLGGLLERGKLSHTRLVDAYIERGKLLYQRGEREAALNALSHAANQASGELGKDTAGQFFVDMLAFLVIHGERDEASMMYHRAADVGLPDAMRVYCSLWVRSLLSRGGKPADPMVEAALQDPPSGKWQANLSRWATGGMTDATLLLHADSTGKKAEAQFYLGMKRLAEGDTGAAQAAWRAVIESEMLGYFEYEMAREYLRRGTAPSTPTSVRPSTR